MRSALAVIVAVAACPWAAAQQDVLAEWTFDDGLQGWGRANHVDDLRVEDGALAGRITDWDPFVISPRFEVAATPWQVVEVRLRTELGGTAELFWTNTTQTQYDGFSPGKETTFEVAGDGQWHTYRVQPWWQAEGRIILLRLDLPRRDDPDALPAAFAVDHVRILAGEAAAAEPGLRRWRFPQNAGRWQPTGGASAEPTDEGLRVRPRGGAVRTPVELTAGDAFWVSIRMAVDEGETGVLRWACSEHNGLNSRRFPLRADGRMHVYNIDMAGEREWDGELLMLELTPSLAPDATATMRSVSIAREPQGPPEVEVTWMGLEDAISRVGPDLPLLISLSNRGGSGADDLRIAELHLPEGMRVAEDGDGWREPAPVEPFEPVTHRVRLSAQRPVQGEVRLTLEGARAPTEPVRAQVQVTPALDLPPAEYVSEPRPVPTEYEIGAYYYPGWHSRDRWERVRPDAPERKPVLGWYDEGDPECVDWQIKWAVEHGISLFMVDWYWNAGSRHNTHWLEAFERARYRRYLKWCVMWANHNPAGSHSEEDQRAVTRHWIDRFFGMDEYYRIDGSPVVIIWSPARMRADMGGPDGIARLLEISQEMAREAGYPGICFVAMKWPEAEVDPGHIRRLADEGFAMTTIYHYMGHGGAAQDPRHYPFELVAQSTLPFLHTWHEADIIPSWPAISTGWDSRPWHGESARVVSGRTVPLFRRICEDVKGFVDETGLSPIALGPLNEWGEGSYIEPCREFGFGMYDAIRDVFCTRPAGGWPPNVVPADVGLGGYDLPPPERRSTWDFEDGPQGWGALMGISDFRAEDGAVCFATGTHDPALTVSLHDVRASDVVAVAIRMRIDAVEEGERGQLFWSTSTTPVSEATSARFDLVGDGEYHDYVLPVGESERWRRQITGLRLDPCSHTGAEVCIDEIRLVAAED